MEYYYIGLILSILFFSLPFILTVAAVVRNFLEIYDLVLIPIFFMGFFLLGIIVFPYRTRTIYISNNEIRISWVPIGGLIKEERLGKFLKGSLKIKYIDNKKKMIIKQNEKEFIIDLHGLNMKEVHLIKSKIKQYFQCRGSEKR